MEFNQREIVSISSESIDTNQSSTSKRWNSIEEILFLAKESQGGGKEGGGTTR
jgi:hypothetical protein